ncbi:MAG TPA: hypothetical protein VMO26_09010 [Vicinamibacterales bacterium]|nr:hypothetical protein [Vicinamibacterales bacterium]
MALITPGLSPVQRAHVADVLHRIGRVPVGRAAGISLEVDAAAGRVLAQTRPTDEDCFQIAEAVAHAYGVDPLTAAFSYGHVLGLRVALRRPSSPRGRRRASISDEYARLTLEHRHAVNGIIRLLLSRQGPDEPAQAPAAPPATEDIKAARRWVRQAGQAARARR